MVRTIVIRLTAASNLIIHLRQGFGAMNNFAFIIFLPTTRQCRVCCRWLAAFNLLFNLSLVRRFQISFGEFYERWPVRSIGVAAAVLAESNIAMSEWSFNRRKLSRAQAAFAKQLIDRPGGGGGHEHSFGVHPAVTSRRAPADKNRRGAHMAMSSWASTGKSPQFNGPAYLMKLPAIQ